MSSVIAFITSPFSSKPAVQEESMVAKSKAMVASTATSVASSNTWKKASAGISKAYEYAPPVKQWSGQAYNTVKSKPYHVTAGAVALVATAAGALYCMGEEEPETWTSFLTYGMMN